MTRANFRKWMQERREAKRKGWDTEVRYLTRACRKCVWSIRNVPPMYWKEMEKQYD